MKQLIYADNAATTRTEEKVIQEMIPWLTESFGNASQLYSFARQPKLAIKEAREIIANCIGALPEEIFFTSGGTESDNWAVKGSAFGDPVKHLTIASAIEHHAVLRSCEAIERLGYTISLLKPNFDGYISPKNLEKVITDDTRLVSVMMANNEIGTIQPIKELCEIAHSKGALFHTDAVQAIGHIEVNVKELGVDMLSASAHKFNGPKGVGFLYIRKGTNIVPLLDGGAQENDRRAGTENVAGIVGMATALKLNIDNLEKNIERINALEKRLIANLKTTGIKFVRNGGENGLPGLISLSFEGKDGEAILHRMDLMGISISTGSACDSKDTEISHVLKAIGLKKELALGTIRISLGKNNTESDVDYIVSAIGTIVN